MEIPELDYDSWGDLIYANASVISEALRTKFSHEDEDAILATTSMFRKFFSNNLTKQFRSELVMKITRSEPKLELSRSFRTIRASDFDAYVDG